MIVVVIRKVVSTVRYIGFPHLVTLHNHKQYGKYHTMPQRTIIHLL